MFDVDSINSSKMTNEKFVTFEYSNANVFTNFEDVGFTLIHSFLFCFLILAFKAVYTITIFNFDYKEAFALEGGFKQKVKSFTMNKLKD